MLLPTETSLRRNLIEEAVVKAKALVDSSYEESREE